MDGSVAGNFIAKTEGCPCEFNALVRKERSEYACAPQTVPSTGTYPFTDQTQGLPETGPEALHVFAPNPPSLYAVFSRTE